MYTYKNFEKLFNCLILYIHLIKQSFSELFDTELRTFVAKEIINMKFHQRSRVEYEELRRMAYILSKNIFVPYK